MKTIKRKQRFKTIVNAIRLAEVHYPEKVVIEETNLGLRVYSQTSDAFNNCKIIAVVHTLSAAHCYLQYDEDIKGSVKNLLGVV